MSTTTCSAGHVSDDPTYCSVCGTKIGSPAPPPAASAPASDDACPSCEAPRASGDAFCEVCGYDFVTGTLPAAPPVQAAPPVHASSSSAPSTASSPTVSIVVSADRGFYDRNEVAEVQFPLGAPERRFTLTDAQVTIGRRSASRGLEPTIDLSSAPEDAAISHSHAALVRQPDGSYALVDLGSTNGTYLNGSSDALAPNTPVNLKAGDYFNVGAWTRITVEQ